MFKKFFFLLVIIHLVSCNKRKYTEVVEVPLPMKEEKRVTSSPNDVKAIDGAFKMVKLPFEYTELEPTISVATMDVHYSKHYFTYTNNLNKALSGTDIESLPMDLLFLKLDMSNEDLKNNLGGYYNHSLFWEILTPKTQTPKDTIAGAILKEFGSFENFKLQFIATSSKQFASGWTWLVVDKTGKLVITNTNNQENPLMPRAAVSGTPILNLDLWEHAYYMDYQYRRRNYIENFFKIINWKKVNEKYEEIIIK